MKIIIFLIISTFLIMPLGAQIKIKFVRKDTIYNKDNYALLIGNSEYINDYWSNLSTVHKDIENVKRALENYNFKVSVSKDLKRDSFISKIENFIAEYGYGPDNQILIYYAGHGDTININGVEKSYIIPIDAPNPNKNKQEFIQKVIPMEQFKLWAENKVFCKHSLFVFDNCFAGNIFMSRSGNKTPPALLYQMKRKARQFITSGSPGKTVPATSEFCKELVNSLDSARADTNQDGYITGNELGAYLKLAILNKQIRQTPQYGNLDNISSGEFIFVVPKSIKRQKTYRIYSKDNGDIILNSRNIEGDIFLDEVRIKHLYKNEETILPKINTGNHKISLKSNNESLWQKKIYVEKNKTTYLNINKNTKSIPPIIQDLENNMIYVQGGEFTMGRSSNGEDSNQDEFPAHKSTVNSFYIGKYEVTQAEWEAIMKNNPSKHKNCPYCPVESVSWEDAQSFIERLNEITGDNYRLPYEKEWEYAAKGGIKNTNTKYSGNDIIDQCAWYNNSWSKRANNTHKVGLKNSNKLKIYDMSGNVWEWCYDYYSDYGRFLNNKQHHFKSNKSRILRGGSFLDKKLSCTTTFRGAENQKTKFFSIGFRLVKSLKIIDRTN